MLEEEDFEEMESILATVSFSLATVDPLDFLPGVDLDQDPDVLASTQTNQDTQGSDEGILYRLLCGPVVTMYGGTALAPAVHRLISNSGFASPPSLSAFLSSSNSSKAFGKKRAKRKASSKAGSDLLRGGENSTAAVGEDTAKDEEAEYRTEASVSHSGASDDRG